MGGVEGATIPLSKREIFYNFLVFYSFNTASSAVPQITLCRRMLG